MITLRSNRTVLFGFLAVVLTTLYFFYPSDHFRSPHTPLDPYGTYEAGGIDSDHWHEAVLPKFENEKTRGDGDVCTDADCQAAAPHKAEPKPKARPLQHGNDLKKGVEAALAAPKKQSSEAEKAILEPILKGGVIMPKMENATAKAELGRSAWRVLHLMTLRYPELPTADDRTALKSYFHLFARLYPCGECAEEFQSLLKQYPPQTSSRKTASMWLCSVHNIINERLGKEEFDCLTLNDVYDCGCGPEGDESKDKSADGAKKVTDKVAAVKDTGVDTVKEPTDKAAANDADAAEGAAELTNDPVPVDMRPGATLDQSLAEKVKEAFADGPAKTDDKPKMKKPFGGMLVKEKAKDGLHAAAGAAAVLGTEDDKKVEPEVDAGRKKKPEIAKIAKPTKEEVVDEEEKAVEDEQEKALLAGDEEELVMTELSGEHEEAEEDDSGLFEDKGFGDGIDEEI